MQFCRKKFLQDNAENLLWKNEETRLLGYFIHFKIKKYFHFFRTVLMKQECLRMKMLKIHNFNFKIVLFVVSFRALICISKIVWLNKKCSIRRLFYFSLKPKKKENNFSINRITELIWNSKYSKRKKKIMNGQKSRNILTIVNIFTFMSFLA